MAIKTDYSIKIDITVPVIFIVIGVGVWYYFKKRGTSLIFFFVFINYYKQLKKMQEMQKKKQAWKKINTVIIKQLKFYHRLLSCLL